MKLDNELRRRCAYRCAAEVVRRRRLTGEPIPPWLREHFDQLDAEIRLSASGHGNSLDVDESNTLSSVETATIIGRTDRWVRRHPEELGGRKHGDRWRFPRATVEQYAAGKDVR
jgi:hypothetical protein